MKPVRSCPHCGHSLQAFLASSRSGVELELERCTQCGGFWGERGRIQDAFGPAARYELVGGETNRRCVLCRILMTPARLPAGIAVEVCSACRGMFLDANELEQIGGRGPARSSLPRPAEPRPAAPPSARAAPPPPPAARVSEPPTPAPEPAARAESTAGTFECIECGQRKPLREGQALRDGLACRACMKRRAEGSEDEELSLRNLLFGRPKN